MIKFNKSLIAMLLMGFSTLAFAQKPITFALLGGVNIQNQTGKNYLGNKLENDMIVGFHIGAEAPIRLADEFYFQPGLLFTTKGAKNTGSGITLTNNLSYLELPLNLVYRGTLGSGFILVGFGPYVAYAIQGKSKLEGGGISLKSDIGFKNKLTLGDPISTTYFRPIDAGGNIFFGYEMASGLFLRLNAQLGMIGINPEDNRFPKGETLIKNTGFGLSLGYRF
jgi:hypothetical protein